MKDAILQKPFAWALVLCLSLIPIGVDAQNESVEIAAQPSPPLWRLTRASNPDSEVWILGTVGSMPRGLEWNKTALGDLMDGARAIVMPPAPSVSIIDAGWFLIWHGGELSLPRGQTLEASLPEPLRSRFIRTRTSLGQDEAQYKTDIPLRAAGRIQNDFQQRNRLTGGEPNRTVRDLARSKKLAIAPVGTFEVMDLARAILKLSPEQQRVCLAEVLEDIDSQSEHAAIAGRAWAIGAFKVVKDHYSESRFFDCITSAVQSITNLPELQVKTYTDAVNTALTKPGKTIVVIGIGPLLRKNGVLERLAAQNVHIDSPPE